MASVKSLGLHVPLGLDGKPLGGKLCWDTVTDDEGEDELTIVDKRVVWKRGGVFRKSFNFEIEKDEPILQALLTYFPTNDADGHATTTVKGATMDQSATGRNKSRSKSQPNKLAKALVVFLKTQAHIFFLSGPSHIVHMPFEVESACAAPVGVIIQRKPRTHNIAPVGLKFPRVPPNSFVSSQLSPWPHKHQDPSTSFSVEGLSLPSNLPLRIGSTMENMFDHPLETNDSHWPRIVCLTDPLLELGLVVTQASGSNKRNALSNAPFLDLSEEILHVQTIEDGLVLAVTASFESNQFTIWQLTYIENEDIFTKHQNKNGTKVNRRQSSVQPRLSSPAISTPNMSFSQEKSGPGSQPGKKKNRKSDKHKSKSGDIAAVLGAGDEGDKARRQSRRVSSLLARADLSASHERTTFAEPSASFSRTDGRRLTGPQRARRSSGPSRPRSSGAHSMADPGHIRAADDLLDELRAGGDFEGFLSMGLEDHSFDGLCREMLLTKIYTMPIDNVNVRYSLSSRPARTQYKVFIVKSPPFAADESGRRELLLGIQDPLDKRLQLLPLTVERRGVVLHRGDSRGAAPSAVSNTYDITPERLTRASSVADSCKISDGDQSLVLILSDAGDGQQDLSIQAPWSAMTPLTLPMLYADNLGSLEYAGTHVNREIKGRRSVGSKVSAADIARIRHSHPCGVVDLEDKSGQIHRIQIQLQPSCPRVRKLLQVCRSVLPIESSEKMLAGWWHVMSWMEESQTDTADHEWSAFIVLILAMFLSLAVSTSGIDDSLEPRPARRLRRSMDVATGSYEKMLPFAAANVSLCPPWTLNNAWKWMVDDETPAIPQDTTKPSHEDLMTMHVRLARSYMKSDQGHKALMTNGYLPTAPDRDPGDRIGAAWAIICGLHLLVEEGKLDIMQPEHHSPGRADIRALLCQIGQWLGWHEFVALHELGLQTDFEPRNHCGKPANSPSPNS